MKNLMAFAGMMILSSVCLAANNIYCPAQITCSISGDVSSCKLSDNAQNWPKIINNGEVESVTYAYKESQSPYQGDYNVWATECTYYYTQGHVTRYIYARNTNTGNNKLQAYLDDSTEWNVDGTLAKCQEAKNRLLCPFQYV
jgi:hypothetical protein